jgi:hypothetical protein
MPKRPAFGTNLGLLSRFASKVRRPAISSKSRMALSRACVDTLEGRTLLSTTFFVSTNGNDSGAGTFAQPYRTIQRAASVANWGDTVDIEGGTYRETVHPAHSGVTFTNYNGQSVTVSGADQLGNWSSAGGSTYQTWSGDNLGEGNNQIFVDGSAVQEARWPSNNYQATIGSYSGGVIYDNSLQQSNGYWNGAVIHITPGDGWVGYAGVVTNSGPGWIAVSLPSLSSSETPAGGNNYYLTGTKNAMISNGQWYMNSGGQVYLNDPSGDNPNWHNVEVKARQYAFDLTGDSNTTIQGINIFAATIHTDWSSSNTVINGITAYYITQFNNLWGSGWSPPGVQGIELNGSGSILENSTIGGSAGDGVFVGASNVTVTNNTIHDVDTSGTDAAAVRTYSNNVTITNNTIYNTGRDGINFKGSGENITGNTIHDFMQLDYDGGGIYTVGNNGNGSTIAWNTIYNATGISPVNNYLDDAGIMLDNYSSNFNVHDNTTWNVGAGIKLNYTSYGEQVYNNHFNATRYAVESNGWVGFSYDWSGSNFHDNQYINPNTMMGSNVGQWNNSSGGSSPVAPPPPAPASPPPPPAPTPAPAATATASLLNTDTTTSGNWSTYYGADGYSVFSANATSNYPSYVQAGGSGFQMFTWASSTSDIRALQNSPGSSARTAGCAFSSGSFTMDVNLTDGKTHEVALSLLDFDKTGRTETVQVTDAGTGAVLSTQNASNFANGEYLVWNLSGHVKITVTHTGGSNAAVSGLFFGGGTGASAPASPAPTPVTTSTIAAKSYVVAAQDTAQSSGLATKYGALGNTVNGSWAEYANVNFGSGVSQFWAQLAVPQQYAGQQIQVRIDSVNGPTIASLTTQSTGSWSNFVAQGTSAGGVTGVHNIFIVFVGSTGIANLYAWAFA